MKADLAESREELSLLQGKAQASSRELAKHKEIASPDVLSREEKLLHVLDDAIASCTTLSERFEEIELNLELLQGSHEALRQATPKLSQLDIEQADTEEQEQRVRELMSKISTMRSLRANYMSSLQKRAEELDISPLLVKSETPSEVVKDALDELREHVAKLEQNFDSQSKILGVLSEVYVAQAGARKQFAMQKQQQEDFFRGLINSYDAYQQIKRKLNETRDLIRGAATHEQQLRRHVLELATAAAAQEHVEKRREAQRKAHEATRRQREARAAHVAQARGGQRAIASAPPQQGDDVICVFVLFVCVWRGFS